jgi:hypothetical protein
VGSQVTLLNNGGDNLAVTVGAAGSDDYAQQSFTFATAQTAGSAYSVSLLAQPAGKTCSVYKGATGTLPLAGGALKVGCEYNYDMVSRSSDNLVLSSGTSTEAAVMGGAGVAVGSTATAYGEGRFVAFISYTANLAAGVSGSFRQIFWHDRMTGDTLLVSATAAGAEGNNDSWAPAISADGMTVAFESHATNLAAGDANGVRDVFVWSALSPNSGVQRVSVGAAGVEANAASFEPTLSGDGKVIAFTSYASNLAGTVAGTTNANVYRRDLTSGTNTLVSAVTGTGNEGNFASGRPSLSEDGSRLAFWSFASNLVAGDTNNLWDIFVYDTTAGLSRVSLANGGGERDQGTDSTSRVVSPTISGNGRYVAYSTTSTTVVSGDTNGAQDVFVVDTQTSGASLSVVRVSVSDAGVEGNGDSPVVQGERVALSYDGNLVTFNTRATNITPASNSVVMRDISAGTTSDVSGLTGIGESFIAMSRNGAYVSFLSGTTGLDSRFNSNSGFYVRYTGLARAWAWID